MTSSEDDEAITIRRLTEQDEGQHSSGSIRLREIRINCPDATGLGVDIMRVLLDFGLHICFADMHTDGTWCFLVLKVSLGIGVPPRWSLLKHRLEEICPRGTAALRSLLRASETSSLQQAFSIMVSSPDRPGMLHALAYALWDADTTVFKAHVLTTPDGEARDEFYVYDNRGELPEDHRILEITDRVKSILGGNADCMVRALPPDVVDEEHNNFYFTSDSKDDDTSTVRRGRRLCRDSTSFLNLHSIVSLKHRRRESDSLGSIDSSKSYPSTSQLSDASKHICRGEEVDVQETGVQTYYDQSAEERSSSFHRDLTHTPSFHDLDWISGEDTNADSEELDVTSSQASSVGSQIHSVAVDWDNVISSSYTLFTMKCLDRKGLLYDIFLTLKDLDLRVGSATVELHGEKGMAMVSVLVQDANGFQIEEYTELMELTERIRQAAALPVRIEVEIFEGGNEAAELIVAANIDSGGRGRPRVTYDVTAGLSAANMVVENADVFVKKCSSDPCLSACNPLKSQEVHRFLVRNADNSPFKGREDLESICHIVRNCLLGKHGYKDPSILCQSKPSSCKRSGTNLGDERLPVIFRTLSSQWKGVAGPCPLEG